MTTKEQWLLVGFAAAILTGCITLLVHDKSATVSEDVQGTIAISNKAQVAEAEKPSIPAEQHETQSLAEQQALETSPPADSPVPKPRVIGVAIVGAVHNPDLYMMEEGARVADLIAAAGGVTENADVSDILLTAPLVDETTVAIPELPIVTMNETRIVARRNSAMSVANPPWYRRSAAFQHPRQAASETSLPGGAPATPAVSQNAAASSATGLLNINQATSEQLQQLPGIGPVFAERIIQERAKQPFMTVDDVKRVSGIAEKRLEAIRPFITAP